MWVVGDVQGYLENLRRVLRDVGLVDADSHWAGGGATLAVLGDLVDRGPDGVGAIELLMRLQREATSVEGSVDVVVGNHDVLLLAAHRFPEQFAERWRAGGGVQRDLERLSAEHVQWLMQLPAMVVHHGALMVHADALFYLEYGNTIDAVNAGFKQVLNSGDAAQWGHLLEQFGEHRAFLGPDGCTNLDRFLATFGAGRLIHGHTPVPRILLQAAETTTGPYVYCDGRCVNVDPGIYLGGPGFAWQVRQTPTMALCARSASKP